MAVGEMVVGRSDQLPYRRYHLCVSLYRHPSLSARKALINSRGQCKLYDFWPVELANDAVNQLLEQKIPPIAWLPPETVFIGQYSEKSDIWSFGVVVWEIFSLGETPFGGLTCAEIEDKLRRKQYLEQPRSCAGGIFGAMLSMWNPSVDKRPSFSNLHMTLQAFLNDMNKTIIERFAEDGPNYFSLEKDSSNDVYIENAY
ncbi:putative fibroblast growth factor receptor 1-like [Apostichopus japonicus]|uniref:Putative fibroblast growth factor receptor 1-like n=1 Tax=Stichopus japonicus TaxID=307972 RepID=A0A2G8KCK4_STIJA|nr:putative fibroblast growth factor receptor 1-like [Apostichopus japonicus]